MCSVDFSVFSPVVCVFCVQTSAITGLFILQNRAVVSIFRFHFLKLGKIESKTNMFMY